MKPSLSFQQPVANELPSLFQSVDFRLLDLPLLHLPRRLLFYGHRVLIKDNPRTVSVLLDIVHTKRNHKTSASCGFSFSLIRTSFTSLSQIGWRKIFPG